MLNWLQQHYEWAATIVLGIIGIVIAWWQLAPEVHTEDHHADEYRAANHEPLRQVGVHDCIKNTHEKRSVRGFDTCARFKPR